MEALAILLKEIPPALIIIVLLIFGILLFWLFQKGVNAIVSAFNELKNEIRTLSTQSTVNEQEHISLKKDIKDIKDDVKEHGKLIRNINVHLGITE